MKRWLAALLLLLGTLAVLPAGAARADGGDPEFLPPQLKGTVDKTLSFNRFPIWAYTVDGDGSYQSDSGRNTLNSINKWMAYKAWAVKASIRLMHYPMQLQPGHLLADEASTITDGLTSGLWNDSSGGLVNAGLLLGGLLALLATALRGLGAGFRTLGRTAGLLVLTTGLLLNLSPLLRGVDDVTGQLAGATFGLVNPDGETAIDKFGDTAWQTLVFNPWIQGEFGTVDVAKRYAANNTPGGIFLNLSPSARLNRYSQQWYGGGGPDFAWWGLDYVTARQVLAGVTAVLATPVALAGVLLAGGWLVYQVLALLLFAGTPILLLLALWLPDRGYALLQRWMMRLFALVVLQIVFAFLLGGFVRLGLVASGVDMITWMGQAVLLTLVSVAVLLTRREWLAVMGAVVNPAGAPRQGLAGRVGDAVRTVVQRTRGVEAPAAAATAVRASLATVPVRIDNPLREVQASNAFASAPVAAANGARSGPEPERQSIIQQRSESVQLIQRASGFAAVGDLSPGRGEGEAGAPQPTKGPAQDASARALGRLRNRDES